MICCDDRHHRHGSTGSNGKRKAIEGQVKGCKQIRSTQARKSSHPPSAQSSAHNKRVLLFVLDIGQNFNIDFNSSKSPTSKIS